LIKVETNANDFNRELFLLSNWSESKQKASLIYQALGYQPRRSPGFFFKIAADDP
jgi:hypothetical protein